jgi:hypothetical protein
MENNINGNNINGNNIIGNNIIGNNIIGNNINGNNILQSQSNLFLSKKKDMQRDKTMSCMKSHRNDVHNFFIL